MPTALTARISKATTKARFFTVSCSRRLTISRSAASASDGRCNDGLGRGARTAQEASTASGRRLTPLRAPKAEGTKRLEVVEGA